jgi:hypothetical protein
MTRVNLRRFVRAHHSASTTVGAVEALPIGESFGKPSSSGRPFASRFGEPVDAIACVAVRLKANCRWSLLRMRLRLRSPHRRHEGASEQMGKTRLQDMYQELNEC